MILTTPAAAAALFVDLVGRRTLDRRAQDGAIEHARHLHVDRITGGTVHLARDVDPHVILADQPELTRLLELLGLDLGRLVRHLRERRDLTVTQPPAKLRMDHDAW